MSSNKLSNTGMLKIASRWLQLLRAGRLSRPSIERIMGRSGADQNFFLRPAPNQDLTNFFSASNIKKDAPFLKQMRRGLNSRVKDKPAQELYSDIIKKYYSATNTRASSDLMQRGAVDTYRNLPSHVEIDSAILPDVIKIMKSKAQSSTPQARTVASLETLAPFASKKNTHKLWGRRLSEKANTDGSYNPLLRGVLAPANPHAGFPSVARHEFAHGFHYIAPKTFEKDVVGRTYQLFKRHPYTQFAASDKFWPESAAQWIASRGKSRGAQKYISDYINTADKQLPYNFISRKPYSTQQLESFRRLSDAALKMDPSGRDAATLLHMSKNYGMPVPLKYTRPELFNPNPYLP